MLPQRIKGGTMKSIFLPLLVSGLLGGLHAQADCIRTSKCRLYKSNSNWEIKFVKMAPITVMGYGVDQSVAMNASIQCCQDWLKANYPDSRYSVQEQFVDWDTYQGRSHNKCERRRYWGSTTDYDNLHCEIYYDSN